MRFLVALLTSAVVVTPASAQTPCDIVPAVGFKPSVDATCCDTMKHAFLWGSCKMDSPVMHTCVAGFPACSVGNSCSTRPDGFKFMVSGSIALPKLVAQCAKATTPGQPDACIAAVGTAVGSHAILSSAKAATLGMCALFPANADTTACETACPGFTDAVYSSYTNLLCSSTTLGKCIKDTSKCTSALTVLSNTGVAESLHLNSRLLDSRCTVAGDGKALCGWEVDKMYAAASTSWASACGGAAGCDVSALTGATKTTLCESAGNLWHGKCAQTAKDTFKKHKDTAAAGSNWTSATKTGTVGVEAFILQALTLCEAVSPDMATTTAATTTTTAAATAAATTVAATTVAQASASTLAAGVAVVAAVGTMV